MYSVSVFRWLKITNTEWLVNILFHISDRYSHWRSWEKNIVSNNQKWKTSRNGNCWRHFQFWITWQFLRKITCCCVRKSYEFSLDFRQWDDSGNLCKQNGIMDSWQWQLTKKINARLLARWKCTDCQIICTENTLSIEKWRLSYPQRYIIICVNLVEIWLSKIFFFILFLPIKCRSLGREISHCWQSVVTVRLVLCKRNNHFCFNMRQFERKKKTSSKFKMK